MSLPEEATECISHHTLINLIKHEIRQLKEEGRDLGCINEQRLIRRVSIGNEYVAKKVWSSLQNLPMRRDYNYYEPSEFHEIRRVRSGKGEVALREEVISKEKVRDKILGGFMGRCAGNMLGKPVELMERGEICKRLERLGLKELKGYFPKNFFTPEELKSMDRVRTTLEGIEYVVRDDDIDYVLLNLRVAEKYGKHFSSLQVGKEWLESLPYEKVYTAERIAYRNLVNGLKPPETATYLNPFREWIGAQIRADLWGYICPANPTLAAELAYRDATLSHVKNGIYGEMMIAAMIAHSFIEEDVLNIIKAGLDQIPERCRLKEAVEYVIDLWKRDKSWEEAIDSVLRRFSEYSPVHVVNNASIVVAALLWGEGEFGKTITKAVMSGLDTDCNGATAGSIVGVMLGYSGISDEDKKIWFNPLNDQLESVIFGFQKTSIKHVVDRIVRLA